MRIFIIIFSVLMSLPMAAQQKITNEGIWKDYTFIANSVPGFNFLNDGKHYTRLEDDIIKKYDLLNGKFVADILNGASQKGTQGFNGKISSYTFNSDESKVLIKSESEQIYRHSSRAKFFVYDFNTGAFTKINDDDTKIQQATFDPNSTKVAFVKENNLYYQDLTTNTVTQITTDGTKNKIINGVTDWVYEEEFAFVKAFAWNADGSQLAFIRFDESEVPEFTMTLYNDDMYPTYETFKYPKVGQKNASVSVHMYDVKKEKLTAIDLGNMDDMYIPRIKWTKDDSKLCIFKMNRHQNDLSLLLYCVGNKKTTELLHETNKYYIDITDNLIFLDNGKAFIWTSEKSGFNHVYLYDMKGNEKRALTQGNYEVTNFYGADEKRQLVYYQSSETSPAGRQVYAVGLDGKGKRNMTPFKGTNRVQFSSTYDYFVNNHSTINSAPSVTVYDHDLKEIRIIEDNTKIKTLQQEYAVSDVEFFDLKTSEDIKLHAWMMKPKDFDPSKQYPVLMTQYSGPGSQRVVDSWQGNYYWWYQQLAQNGYIVVCVDPRGTGGRGEDFKKMTYMKLGHYETIDQIESAKYLGGLDYIDASRIGIFGWSYGGYMSSLCILKGNDVFKAAIAVAPVTCWKWYDSIYTERYMRTLAENEDGYNDNSPIYFADQLKGNYLLVHGIGDDNVHFQHTTEMMNALIKANKQFDSYVYPNRNHGIYGDNARLHLWTKMNNFIQEKL